MRSGSLINEWIPGTTHLVLDKLGSEVFLRFLERACVNVSLYDSDRFTETGADLELERGQKSPY